MVIDTSIFIEFLRAKDKTKTALFLIPDDEQIFISSITLYELLMGAYTHIAATCLVNNFPVKTLNIKHYNRIIGLSVE